jgi:hypothetical protein
MAYQRPVLTQILEHVNRQDFKNQVSKHNGDHKVSKVSCFNLLVALIYTHLRTNRTIRDIVIGFQTAIQCFYHLGLKALRRSTISDALKNRPAKVFEDYYYHVLGTLNRRERRKLGMKIHLIDSTTISLCLEKFEWAKYRRKKGGIKLHVMLDGETKIAEQVHMSNAVVHDMKGIKGKIDFQKGHIYVYDRGYVCYEYLHEIQGKQAFFVTRLKSNAQIKVIKTNRCAKTSGIRKDQIIRITGTKASSYPEKLRVITFYHEEAKKTLQFLTNNFKMSAKRIAAIYKLRWQIELFFKWMKQHLKVKTFLSTTENGVRIQIWTALITYALLHLTKAILNMDFDIFEIYRRVQDHLFERRDLYDLLTDKLRPPVQEMDGQQELFCA